MCAKNEQKTTKNAGELLAILIAMRVRRYDAGRIARWITFRALLEATGCSHRIAPAAAMIDEFVETTQNTNKKLFLASQPTLDRSLVVCENFETRKGPYTHVIDATSFV